MAIKLTRTWIDRSAWAILDQGFFAASNFILNVLLARWLGVEAYGAFGVAFTVFLFVGIVHTSLLTEPMLVFSAGRYKESTLGYVKNLLKLHWRTGWLTTAAITLIASILYWTTPSKNPILLLAVLTGPMLYPWLLRRACYPSGFPRFAAESGALYLFLLLGSITILRHTDTLTVLTGLLAMGICAGLSGIWIHWRLTRPGTLTSDTPPSPLEIKNSHLKYGKWALLTGIVGWIPGNVAMLFLPVWGGVEASGEYRAAFNLVLPVQQLLAAAGPLMLPFLVRSREAPGYQRKVVSLAAAFMVAPAIWTVILSLAGTFLASLLYRDSIPLPTHVLVLLGFQTIVGAGVLVLATGIRAIEQPKEVFKAYSVSCALSVIVGIPLMATQGLTGAAIGGVVSAVGSGIMMIMVFNKTVSNNDFARPATI